jgi:hypothetical protein
MRPAPRHRRLAAWSVLVLLAAALPGILFAAISALRSTSNGPRQWLPRGYAEADRYDWCQEQFGSDQISVLSWDGCQPDTPWLSELASRLEQSVYFDRVRT